MTDRPWLVLVGGFLGAGKTTLILAAARELARRGTRCAAILNDQGGGLIDTELARSGDLATDEVTGGCFCCRFSDFAEAALRLRDHGPEVIFAEPVGSCTDIAATTIRPLQGIYPDSFRLAPFTVLVDPGRAAALLGDGADQDLAYLFQKQIEEADLVCFSKADRHPDVPEIPGVSETRTLSAANGQGVAAWLDEVLSGQLMAGTHNLDIDYERYAGAEAALAWLNLDAAIECDPPASAPMLLGPLFEAIESALTAGGIQIVHLKAVVENESGLLKVAICNNGEEPQVDGRLDAAPTARHRLLINLRARGVPERVGITVRQQVALIPSRVEIRQFACFSPAAPRPQHRVNRRSPARVT